VDRPRPIPLPVDWQDPIHDWLPREVAGAIALVAEGGAVSVTIANIEITDDLAGEAAALAQRAGVAFSVERDPVTARRAMRIGPRS
jgi:hypothetical protein